MCCSDAATTSATSQAKKPRFGDFAKYEDPQPSRVLDELKRYTNFYIDASIKKDLDVLQWWQRHQSDFPLLAKMVKKLYCIPASSASSERVFNTAGRTYDERRSNLKPECADSLILLHALEHSK